MRKQQLNLIFGIAVSFALVFAGCSGDPCKDETCNNNGIPVVVGDECDCDCDTGYEGERCEDLVQDNYTGSYNMDESCDTGNDTYGLQVSSGNDELSLVFNNLYDVGFNTNGTIQSDGTVNIPSQSFGTGSISGNASISSTGTLTINFTISSSGVSDDCTATSN